MSLFTKSSRFRIIHLKAYPLLSRPTFRDAELNAEARGVRVVGKDSPRLKRYTLSVTIEGTNTKTGEIQLENLRLSIEGFNEALKSVEFDHEHKDVLFGVQGRRLMEHVCKASSAENGGYVHWQAKTKTILLYGNELQIKTIQQKLLAYVEGVLKAQTQNFFVKKQHVRKMSQNANSIRRLEGIYHFSLVSRSIELKATDAGMSSLRKLLLPLKIELQTQDTEEKRAATGADICTCCWCELESPEMLSCGHQYCKGCLNMKICSAANGDGHDIPLKCDKEGCGSVIVFRDIERNVSSKVRCAPRNWVRHQAIQCFEVLLIFCHFVLRLRRNYNSCSRQHGGHTCKLPSQ